MFPRRMIDESDLGCWCAWRVGFLFVWLGLACLPSNVGGADRFDSNGSDDDFFVRLNRLTGSPRQPKSVWFQLVTQTSKWPNVVKPAPHERRIPVFANQREPFIVPRSGEGSSAGSHCSSSGVADPPLPPPPRPLCFCTDLTTVPIKWADDIGALVTYENGLFLGVAGGIAAVLHNNVDARVTHDLEQHGPYFGRVSDVLKHGGDSFAVHVPLLVGLYGTSLWQQNDDLHELALTLFASYKFSVLSSLTLQYATGTRHSHGGGLNAFGDSGFPSTPTATSFALAAVVDERYGWKGGVPAYFVASVIGWSEIDQRQHTVSEVLFGAALGFTIGKSIGARHDRPDAPFKLIPFIDTYSGTQGIAFERSF